MRASRLLAGTAIAAAALVLGYAGVNSALPDVAQAADGPTSAMRVDNFRLADQNLLAHELYRLADAKAVVIMTQANGDAAVRAEAPAFKALQAAYADKGVEFRLLNSNLKDARDAVAADVKALGLDVPVMLDTNQLVGEQLGVTRTAEVFVINTKTWNVAFHGPLAGAKAAVEALAAGRPVTVASQPLKGNPIAFPDRDKKAGFQNISYTDTIAPMIKDKCAECHQPGGIGPMALNNYEQIKGFAPMIRETIRTKRMPPYHADPTVQKYHDDKSLSPTQIKTLVHWIEAGAPRGRGADPLAAVKFQAPDWPLGKPDLVLDIPAYDVPATGIVDYQHPYAVNPATEGRWLRASTIKVNERQAVHHILTGYMAQVPGAGRNVDGATSGGASVGGYAVGAESQIQPEGLGVYVPAGGAIGFQNHYTPFGKAVTDRSQIAFYYYPKDKTPPLMMRNGVIADQSISIAPNTEHHREVAYIVFPQDAILYGAFPHAHYRGNSAKVILRTPDGKEQLLVALPKYDFNWQREYTFETPVKIPAGSKLIADYTYDNSKRNPSNPDSNRVVPWGDQSFDEMLYTAIRYRWVDETTAKQLPQYNQQLNSSRTLGMLDDNIDGRVQLTELKGRMGQTMRASFPMLDANNDGGLDATELAAVQGGGGRGARPQQAAPAPAAPVARAQ